MFIKSSALLKPLAFGIQRRLLSDSTKNSKRYLQTINQTTNNLPYSYVPLNNNNSFGAANIDNSKQESNGWNRHSLSKKPLRKLSLTNEKTPKSNISQQQQNHPQEQKALKQAVSSSATAAPRKRRRELKPRKALITLTPNAISHLKGLLDQPDPKYIKVGVKNRGCSGLSYHLEYVSNPEKFDEVVTVDDNVKIIIDSKALFSIIGSEMDYVDDKLSSRFVFKNPNSKGSCGCGESFMV